MIVAGFIIAFLIGWGLIRLLSRREEAETFQDLFLAWGLGVGVASQLSFYSIFPSSRLIPGFVCFLGICTALALWSLLALRHKKPFLKISMTSEIFFCGFLLFCAILFLYQAVQMPYGGYDAWSLWNYRAAAVFRGTEHWAGVFHNEVQGSHPWLLPFVIAWGWSFAGSETPFVPVLTAAITAFATTGLLVCSLQKDIGWWKAILGGIFLFFIPFFAWHSISQYASIMVAYYMLAACACLKILSEEHSLKYSVLSAAFLGLLAFSKDDGIFLALMCLVSFFMFLKPQALFKNRAFWLTLAGVTLAVILVELFMRTHVLTRAGHIVSNRYLADPEQFFMLERWQEIGSYVWNRIILHAEFGRLRLWLPLLGVGLFYPAGRFILFSILGYFAVFFFLYAIVATDLAWRLDVTLDRLLFQVLPAMVFVLFHSLFRHKA